VGELSSPGVAVVVRDGPSILASTVALPGSSAPPTSGSVTVRGRAYRAVSQLFTAFGHTAVTVTVISALSATATSLGVSRAIAVVLIGAFLVLALGFSLLASRALQGRLRGFLDAARRLGSGDFSAPTRIEGNDEFAALGVEFNSMSSELSRRLDELSRERVRLREAIRRIGHAFASSLDRPALLELALNTAIDAVQGGGGRISIRASDQEPLAETGREGSLAELEDVFRDAERAALSNGGIGEAHTAAVSVAAVTLSPLEPSQRAHGVISGGSARSAVQRG
jgi:HAMP domain-containing protein